MNGFLVNIIPIFIGIVIFGIVVIVHEFGHFIAARKCGILVEEFAIGMGPKLFGFQPGETLYTLRALPLGGFCRMLGEETESDDKRSFNEKSVPQRIIVILAGATMNMILGLLLFMFIAGAKGFETTTVYEVTPNSPAAQVGLMPGDEIIEINDANINTFMDIPFQLYQSEGEPVTLTIERDGATIETEITPIKTDEGYKIGIIPTYKAGIFENDPEVLGLEYVDGKVGIFESMAEGYHNMIFLIKETVWAFGQLITFNISIDAMSGPIGIFDAIGDGYEVAVENEIPAKDIFMTMLGFTALLSVAIGIFNLFPIPALDGGRFVFLIIEGIRRKPISQETEGKVHFVGFVLLMLLFVVVTFNDITKVMFN